VFLALKIYILTKKMDFSKLDSSTSSYHNSTNIGPISDWHVLYQTRPKVYRFGLRDKQKETKEKKETKETKESKETKEKRKEEIRKEEKRKKKEESSFGTSSL